MCVFKLLGMSCILRANVEDHTPEFLGCVLSISYYHDAMRGSTQREALATQKGDNLKCVPKLAR